MFLIESWSSNDGEASQYRLDFGHAQQPLVFLARKDYANILYHCTYKTAAKVTYSRPFGGHNALRIFPIESIFAVIVKWSVWRSYYLPFAELAVLERSKNQNIFSLYSNLVAVYTVASLAFKLFRLIKYIKRLCSRWSLSEYVTPPVLEITQSSPL